MKECHDVRTPARCPNPTDSPIARGAYPLTSRLLSVTASTHRTSWRVSRNSMTKPWPGLIPFSCKDENTSVGSPLQIKLLLFCFHFCTSWIMRNPLKTGTSKKKKKKWPSYRCYKDWSTWFTKLQLRTAQGFLWTLPGDRFFFKHDSYKPVIIQIWHLKKKWTIITGS